MNNTKSDLLCRYCSKKFNHLSIVKRHELIHTGEKPFSCQYCNKAFIKSKVGKRHENKLCTIRFKKPHYCKYCNKKFNDLSLLKRHELIHTGEKPFNFGRGVHLCFPF